jgi:hypothetical protein
VVKLIKLAFGTLILSCLQPSLGLACRCNVRDVGFVDLETEPYHFYCFVRRDTAADLVAQFKGLSSAMLADCNIGEEVINLDQQKDHAALKYLPADPVPAFPIGVLVSPDGQSLRLALAKSGQSFRQSLASVLDEIVSSAKRDEIVQQVTKAYAAILLIEGPNADENRRAREAIADVIEQIRGQLTTLPKPIAHPPSLVVLDAASFARERILLWSLGLEPDQVAQTRAAVIYGKARWIGPLMKDQEINTGNLGRLLSILGADCECGLDISWTQGTRLPMRWDEKLHTEVAKALGFDPENPLVKLEVGRIIGRRGSSTAASGANPQGLVAQTKSSAVEAMVADGSNKSAAPDPGTRPTVAIPTVVETPPVLRTSLLFLAGMAVLALGTGGGIILRAARKRRVKN